MIIIDAILNLQSVPAKSFQFLPLYYAMAAPLCYFTRTLHSTWSALQNDSQLHTYIYHSLCLLWN